MRFSVIFSVFLLMLSGCNTEEANTAAEISPIFTSEGSELQGTKGKIAILGPEFAAGKPNKYMWHFWGTEEELGGQKDFRVEAVHTKTGEKIDAFPMNFVNISLGGPNNGADAHMPTTMTIPEPGVCRLDAYLDEKLFGSVTVEVK